MTITADDIVTKVCQLSSLYQLSQEREQLGEPCLLLMYVGDGTVLGSDDSEKAEAARFLAEADFMTAVVSEGDISDELASAADLVLRADETDEYVAKLFKDKTKKQIKEINACFIKARTAPAEEVLATESRAFYRLMADKNGGNSNE